MKLIYLACPYSHKESWIREARVAAATACAGRLMTPNQAIFSPITHGHAVAEHLPGELLLSHEFWMRQCVPVLRRCDELIVLPLNGWITSAGVMAEVTCAMAARIPVSFLTPNLGTDPSALGGLDTGDCMRQDELEDYCGGGVHRRQFFLNFLGQYNLPTKQEL